MAIKQRFANLKSTALARSTIIACGLLLATLAWGAPVFPEANWPTKSTQQLGMDAGLLDDLALQLGGRGCVIKNGYVVKTWGDQAQLGDWFSSAKPVLSTMLFFAIEEGLVKSVDQRVGDFGWDFKEKDRPMTFRHLGGMTSGYARPEAPGAAWSYNDYAIQLYQKTLFDKVYKGDPKKLCENPKRLGGLQLQDGLEFSDKRRISASVRDWARICWFWMNRGNWRGKQLLPQRYFDEYMKPQVSTNVAFTAESPTDDYLKIGSYGGESFRKAHHGPGIYGFNWWFNATGPRHPQTLTWPDAPPDTTMSLGFGGNSSAIIPSLGLVIVCASGAWDDLKPGSPASKINLALRVAARAAGYHQTNPAASYFPPPDSKGGWRTLNSAEEIRKVAGLDKGKLDVAFEAAAASEKNGALLVVRNGWLAYERYVGRGTRDSYCNLASCGKSYTSIAVGILMKEHPELFRDVLETKIFSPAYLPDEAFPLSDPAKAEIKLGHLLCFTSGIRGNTPGYVHGQAVTIEPEGPDGYKAMIDAVAVGNKDTTTKGKPISARTLWCKPGEGYSYATASAHIASMIVRKVAGMELEDYLRARVAEPTGWGRFTFAYKQNPEVTHSPGGGGIAVRPTDVVRFGYLLLREGRWNDRQLVPADYVHQCGHKSDYNPHYPYSLQFNVNTDGQIPELPRDTFFKGGAGGHVLWIIPSLDLVVWRLAGRDDQYDEANTGIPLTAEILNAAEPRKDWKSTMPRNVAERQIISNVVASVISPGTVR
jgi:CubicO group peptidase (beta-lactamase class C family)